MRAMNEPAVEGEMKGKTVVTADEIELGEVEAETASHIRVRCFADDVAGGYLWLPKQMVRGVEGDAVHLDRLRAELHDAVLALSPGEQREFGTLGLSVRIGRLRGLGHAGR